MYTYSSLAMYLSNHRCQLKKRFSTPDLCDTRVDRLVQAEADHEAGHRQDQVGRLATTICSRT
jgi:hypothetical protein